MLHNEYQDERSSSKQIYIHSSFRFLDGRRCTNFQKNLQFYTNVVIKSMTVKRLTKHGKIHLKNYICERQKPLKLYLSNQFIKSSVIYQIFARAGKIATSNKTADNAHNVKVTICKQILTMRYGSRLSYEEVALLQ